MEDEKAPRRPRKRHQFPEGGAERTFAQRQRRRRGRTRAGQGTDRRGPILIGLATRVQNERRPLSQYRPHRRIAFNKEAFTKWAEQLNWSPHKKIVGYQAKREIPETKIEVFVNGTRKTWAQRKELWMPVSDATQALE